MGVPRQTRLLQDCGLVPKTVSQGPKPISSELLIALCVCMPAVAHSLFNGFSGSPCTVPASLIK